MYHQSITSKQSYWFHYPIDVTTFQRLSSQLHFCMKQNGVRKLVSSYNKRAYLTIWQFLLFGSMTVIV